MFLESRIDPLCKLQANGGIASGVTACPLQVEARAADNWDEAH